MQLTKEYQQYFEQKARGEKFLYGLPFEYEMTSILDESTIEEATANLQKDLHSIESPCRSLYLKTFILYSYFE